MRRSGRSRVRTRTCPRFSTISPDSCRCASLMSATSGLPPRSASAAATTSTVSDCARKWCPPWAAPRHACGGTQDGAAALACPSRLVPDGSAGHRRPPPRRDRDDAVLHRRPRTHPPRSLAAGRRRPGHRRLLPRRLRRAPGPLRRAGPAAGRRGHRLPRPGRHRARPQRRRARTHGVVGLVRRRRAHAGQPRPRPAPGPPAGAHGPLRRWPDRAAPRPAFPAAAGRSRRLRPAGEPAAVGGGRLRAGVEEVESPDPTQMFSTHPEYVDALRHDPLVYRGAGPAADHGGDRADLAGGGGGRRGGATVGSDAVPARRERPGGPGRGLRAIVAQLPRATLHIFPGDLHDILNEHDRDAVHDVVAEFVGAQVGRAPVRA